MNKMKTSRIRPCRNAARPQDRRGLPTEYKAINRLFLNEGHSHGATELKFLLLNEGAFPRNIDDEAVLFLNDQRGFTLIELLVGLALGLIASLAIFTTITSFETQRRTTGGGADMQQNGLLSLYSIEQDIRTAGFGLIDASTTPGSLPCTTINAYNPAGVFRSAPVRITDGGAGNDSLAINQLNSDTGGIITGGGGVVKVNTTVPAGSVPSSIPLNTNWAIKANDFILVSQPGLACTLLKVSASDHTNPTGGVTVATSSVGATTPAFPGYAANAVVINLGANPPTLATTQYQINDRFDLMRSEDGGATWNTIASNIVAVAAQYGVADAGSQPVTCWTNATGNACSGTDWSNPTTAEVQRIKAIRVAIVARSAQRDNQRNAGGVCTTTTASPTSWVQPVTSPVSSPAPVIDLSTPADWRCYRYKVYQTIIPIRNVIWGNL